MMPTTVVSGGEGMSTAWTPGTAYPPSQMAWTPGTAYPPSQMAMPSGVSHHVGVSGMARLSMLPAVDVEEQADVIQ